jgi:hypothetical protein
MKGSARLTTARSRLTHFDARLLALLITSVVALLAPPVRPWSLISLVAVMALVTLSVSTLSRLALTDSLMAAVIGLGPALILLGALQEASGARLPVVPLRIVVLVAWWAASSTLGTSVIRAVRANGLTSEAWSRFAGSGVVTIAMGVAVARNLLPGADAVDRLSWIIGEEDNASFVGVAREVLSLGPAGGDLTRSFGAGYMNLPLAVLDLMGGHLEGEVDPRLQAITLFNVSTILVIVIAGLAMGLLVALSSAPHLEQQAHLRERPAARLIAALVSGGATAIGFSLLVVLPMRTGFLAFVWGVSLVLLASAVMAILPVHLFPAVRIVAALHVVSTAVLLLGTWPFIAAALAPLGILLLIWVPWSRAGGSVRRHPALASVLALASVGIMIVSTLRFMRSGPLASVLSVGREILTVGGSGITADAWIARGAALSSLALVIVLVLRAPEMLRFHLLLSTVGPIAAAAALYVALRIAAFALTEGVLNYSGVKLLYGVVTLASTIGLLALVAWSPTLPKFGGPIVGVLVASLLVASPTARLIDSWWDRTDVGRLPHAEAAVASIEASSPDLPIRCTPLPGTPASAPARWAAYYCVRWMEDAFNEDRFHGHRFTFLEAESATFEAALQRAQSDDMSRYMFAYPMILGPGWFGWDGIS